MHINQKPLIVLLLLACIDVISGQSWNFVGGPQGIFPNDVIFTKDGRVLCSTWNGVFISDDFGDNWRISESSQNFYGIFSLTERINGEVIAVSGYGIVKSFDKGDNWVLISDISYLNDYGVRFRESPIDSSLYFVKDSILYKSTDGGYLWNRVWDSNNSFQIIDDIIIDESGFIYVAVRYNSIFRSTDNGKSFQPVQTGYDLRNSLFSNMYPDKRGGFYFFINQYQAKIVHVGAGKVSEINISSYTYDLPLGITSEGNLIYKSGDCIAVFNPSTESSVTLSCPFFVKEQFGKNIISFGNIWIANFQYLGIHRSDNAGRTWKSINTGLGYKESIALEITNSGKMIVSAFSGAFWGCLYSSVDDGKTWMQNNPALDPYFMDIDKLNNGDLIAAGSYGIFRSDKEGINWIQKSDLDFATSVFVSKSGVTYAGTYSHGIMISRDNGNSWYSVNGLQHSYFTTFGESSTGRIFAGASAYTEGYYYSDDEGRTWTHVDSSPLREFYDFVNKKDTLYASTSAGLYLTEDNGSTWKRINYGYYKKLALSFNGDLIAIVPGKGILKSNDNGNSWETLGEELNNRSVWDICFDNDNRLFAVTDSGIFRNDEYIYPSIISPKYGAEKQKYSVQLEWRTIPSADYYEVQLSTDSLFNSIIQSKSTTENSITIGPLKPNQTYYWKVKANTTKFGSLYSDLGKFTTAAPFSISQNYPNPFNIETVIEFYVPYNSRITLKVYNILGELTDNLVDNEFPEGKYTYNWNASGLSSGIYFLQIEGDEFRQTKKAVLLK